jgi:hypothetical protein
MVMRYSAVLIVPADLKPQADTLGAAMGWGSESYTIPIPDAENPTHYGLRADVDAQFIRWIKGIEPLPESCADLAAPVIAALIWDFSPDPTIEAPEDDETYSAPPVLWGRKHLDAVIAAHGLGADSGEDDA